MMLTNSFYDSLNIKRQPSISGQNYLSEFASFHLYDSC